MEHDHQICLTATLGFRLNDRRNADAMFTQRRRDLRDHPGTSSTRSLR